MSIHLAKGIGFIIAQTYFIYFLLFKVFASFLFVYLAQGFKSIVAMNSYSPLVVHIFCVKFVIYSLCSRFNLCNNDEFVVQGFCDEFVATANGV